MNKGDCFAHIVTKDEVNNTELFIEIPFEEYKELLIIKGKYEELKSQYQIPWTTKSNTIIYRDLNKDEKQPEYPYKVTCDTK